MKSEKQIVLQLIQTLQLTLQELSAANLICNDFICGQIYACVECLEILQQCPAFRNLGLNYDIEKKYPLS